MAGQVFDLATVQKKTPEDALAELKKQGITSLEDLVNKSMAQIRSTPSATAAMKAKVIHSFIYVQFVYYSEE